MIEHTLKRLGIPPSADYVKAFDDFIRWATEGEQDYMVRRRRATAAFRLGDYATALQDARWCLVHRPRDVEAHVLAGLAAIGGAAAEILPIGLVGAGGATMAEEPAQLLQEARLHLQRALQQDGQNAAATLALDALANLEARAPRKRIGVVPPRL